ncbi:hypothetical protein [Bifidobacterium vespertilionis]|uniref:Uncharacterized protein n=1 Tax=Bifidobacterium vespertilionis TaxID=2562524 RepID=A0A5J5DVS3_9BIFI|nr:hypothetical protein [Bifidobacterium vespertilionis]KAA8820924.1 hypothetical protein EMO90_05510 [Bifidobacterium vespertilionis]KAA8822690.1 hypothetical protein EM848_08180 [Bifidobacterium vespertilionis]
MKKHVIAVRYMACAMIIAVVSAILPFSLNSASAYDNYNCSYSTHKEYSVNFSCDAGIQHVLILYGTEKRGPRVAPGDDDPFFNDGPGVSRVAVLPAQVPAITRWWMRVYH